MEIDIDGRMIGIRYPMDAHLVGDAKETLKAPSPPSFPPGFPTGPS